MKKHLIIGNPISHTLSPKLHNYWFEKNRINGEYDKVLLKRNEIESSIKKIKTKELHGMNVTVPYKQLVIPYLESLSETAKITNSVNTIFNKDGKIHGDNTDVFGFQISLSNNNIDLKNKDVFIFGAGGVVPSIILALTNLNIKKIYLSNRTLKNANLIKDKFNFVEVIEWGKIINCDLFINSTSVGLKNNESLGLNFENIKEKKIFYDVIYNPSKTSFLLEAEKKGHRVINGREMFLYQAQKAFNLWHNLTPKIDDQLINYLYND
ncbi:shikimate dehydrogenase [Candidatus Pelagibacter sp.]|nr:shikimate dehydrogenase [Candidatus Pelagibacter sp.]